ncbi:sodium:solute symporter family transporter, partial [Candidatus Cardinium hertigii]
MPIVIIGAFLLSTLLMGIYFSRKRTTFREYAIGNKQFATATLVATVLATLYAGCTLLCNVECIYEYGLWWIIIVLVDCFGLCVISRLALRMNLFINHLSIAETMGEIYGKYSRIFTALIGICRCMIIITMQINVMSRSISMYLDSVDPFIITILTT